MSSTFPRGLLFVVAPLVALAACSSTSGGHETPAGGDDAGGSGAASDDAAVVEAASPAPDGSTGSPTPQNTAAGKAGVDAFCSALCGHAQTCAAMLDASPAGLADCATNCQTANESRTTSPPTELLRADYLSQLGTCIANASCNEALQTSETICGAALVGAGGDAGVTALVPTQAVAVFCHDFETSPCAAGDAGGAADCVTEFLSYSDAALNAAIACFAKPSCSDLASCYAAAFTQM